MAYVYPNFRTKKALKEAIKAGEEVVVKENTPSGQNLILFGGACIEGPHFPKPHRWYANVVVDNGIVIDVK